MILGGEGEQKIISNFNVLFLMYPFSSYSDSEIQKKIVKALLKKFPADSWQRIDIEASKLPQDTVKQFTVIWKTVRMNAQRTVEQAKRFGCVYQIDTDSKNYKLKTQRGRST